MSKVNKDLSVREKRLQMDLDKEVKDFVLKLTKQHKNKSRHRLKLRRSICTRYVDDSTTGLPESTYLSRLISSPFLPHLPRPKTVSEARKLPKPPKRRSVSAGNRAFDSLEVRSSTVKAVQHFPANRAQLRTPPSQWGFASTGSYEPSSTASSSSLYSRPSTGLSYSKTAELSSRPYTSPTKPGYDIDRAKDDQELIRKSATLTPLRIDQMKMGSNIAREYLAAKKHAKDRMGLKVLLQIGQKYHAASTIQSLVRMWIATSSVWGSGGINENHKAIKIQCTFRGYASRNRDKLDYKAKCHSSAVMIQKYFRRKLAIHFVATLRAMREASAIALIQRMIRGALGRKFVKRKIFFMRQNAATLIQKHWRRYMANTMHGVVQQRRKERAIQRRTIKLYRTGVTAKAYYKDPDNLMVGLQYALGLFVVDKDQKQCVTILRQLNNQGLLNQLFSVAISLASNQNVAQSLGILLVCRLEKQDVTQDDNQNKKLNLAKSLDCYKTLLNGLILGWVCTSPSETSALIFYTIALMVFEYVVYGLIQDQTRHYLRRLVCRIKGAPYRHGIEQLVSNVENLFETWFLVDRTHLTQHTLSENECGNRSNSIMIGKRIDISVKKNNWVILRIESKTESWSPFIMQVPVDLRTQKDLLNFSIDICSKVRAIRIGEHRYRLVLPRNEHIQQLRSYSGKRHNAALKITKFMKGWIKRKRNFLSLQKQEMIHLQKGTLQKKLQHRDLIRRRRHELISKVKASFIGHKARLRLDNLHDAAIQCQKIIRGMLGKLKFEEEKNFQKYGAQIVTMFERGKCVSGNFLLLQVYRSGRNYLIRGNDFENCCTYQGLVRDEHVRALVRCHPYGRDSLYSLTRAPKLRVWHFDRITALLIKCLALTDAIHGLGELDGFDGSKVMICDIRVKSKAHGPSILSRAGLRRILFDTKDIVFPPEGSRAWKRRQKEKILLEKRKRAKTAPPKKRGKDLAKAQSRPKTTAS